MSGAAWVTLPDWTLTINLHVFLRSLYRQVQNFRMPSLLHTFNAVTPTVTVHVTVTEAFLLRPLLEDRGRITESIRILVPVDRMKQKCFRSRRNESVDRSSVGSLFAVQQQKRLCRQFVDVSAAQRGCHTMNWRSHPLYFYLKNWWPF